VKAREQAAMARDQAAMARDQAKELLNFLVNDLANKLASIGRSDLLEAIQKRVEGYYKQMGTEGMSDDILRRISISYDNIGDVQSDQGDRKAALESYRKALEIITKLASSDPSNTDWQSNLSKSYDGIGNVQRAQGDLKTALESYHKALDIRTKLASSDPSNTGWQRDRKSTRLNSSHVAISYAVFCLKKKKKKK